MEQRAATHGKSGPSILADTAATMTALSMTLGRRASARLAVELAGVRAGDRLVDVGCGPGTAVREARRCGATATGVDPSRPALRLARWIATARRMDGVVFLDGVAEALPLPDAGATVLWSLSAVHHWRDRLQGLAEARRVVSPGGRLLVAERLVSAAPPRRPRHGISNDGAAELVRQVEAVGFVDAVRQVRKAGLRTFVVITASAPDALGGRS